MIHKNIFFLCLSALLFTAFSASAQRYMEKLNRGLIAVKSGSGYFLSWRLFGTDPQDNTFGFNVYRGSTKLNAAVITNATCFQDDAAGSGTYTVKQVKNGVEGIASENALLIDNGYLNVPLTSPGSSYAANDCSVGDLDGDGQYDIVVKWEDNPHDNSGAGATGTTVLQGYKLDGTKLWTIDLGKNIRCGAHYTQFMVYDLDGDGIAEIACKTAPGTKDASGGYIKMGPAATASNTTDYRNSDGKIMTGPEYFTIFSGKTGLELATADYIPGRGNTANWGGIGGNGGNDNTGNRVDRMLACVAYCDGERPSVVMCRGYYGRSVLAAWDWRGGKLTSRWTFDSQDGTNSYSGMGNHNISVGDVDQDGKDEIVYGSMCVDDDGKGLYTTMLRHGDAMHLGDFDPDRPGLEVFGVHENETVIADLPGWGAALFDAKTGEIIYGWQKGVDGTRACVDNIMPTKGCQCWWNASVTPLGLMSCKTGLNVGAAPSSCNFLCWWDGDLVRSILNDITISKYGGSTQLTASGCSSNNGTKATPCLSADIFGDWREEVILRTPNSSALRIYTTTIPTTNRIYTLMHDPQYRLAIAWQNVGYNQPPHTGFYLGYGMTLPAPKPAIKYYDGSNISTTMPNHIISTTQKTTSFMVVGGKSFSINKQFLGSDQSVSFYDLAGKLVQKAVITKNNISPHHDWGIADKPYIARVTTSVK